MLSHIDPSLLLCLLAIAVCGFGVAACAPAGEPTPNEPTCSAELRSWVVAGRGRHLYLEISGCPAGYEHLEGRVEFTEARLRTDYRPPQDRALRNRVVKMSRGYLIQPPPLVGRPDNRLEESYTITVSQAAELVRDRIFSSKYQLLGTNSTTGLRAAMEAAGIEMPPHILSSGGALGAFPGVDATLGPEIPAERYPMFGFPGGPEPVPTPLVADP